MLDDAAVRRATSGLQIIGAPGTTVEVHAELPSTNDRASAIAAQAAEGSIVLAERQTAGRGRHGRAWVSPAGGLYLSIVLRPDDAMLRRLPVTLLARLAVAEAIDDVLEGGASARADLKWPNDVHLGDRKTSGVLADLSKDARGPVLILGVGVNVSTSQEDLPEELRAQATSVAAAAGWAPTLEAMLAAFARRFEGHYLAVRRGGGANILAAASSRMTQLGRPVRVRLPGRVLEGKAAGLSATGGLIVEGAAGERETVLAGEVEEVRGA
jgi:BirA family biotin operon repressor/biotin-[acetyl-CoA-carboxylase] ligase